MRPGTHFAIELEIAGTASANSSRRFHSEADVLAFANSSLQHDVELFVACLGNQVDFGNFIISAGADNNFDVRVHEHRGFLAHGVTREHALQALAYWLPSQDRLPSLAWSEE